MNKFCFVWVLSFVILSLSSCGGRKSVSLSEAQVSDSLVLSDSLIGEPMTNRVDLQILLPSDAASDTLCGKISANILKEASIGDSASNITTPDSALSWLRERLYENARVDFSDNVRTARRISYLREQGADIQMPPFLSQGIETQLSMTELQNADGFLSLRLSAYQYNGGAHGNSIVKLMSYDLKTGDRLLLEDVFVEGYEPFATEAIRRELMAEYGYKSEEQMLMDGFFNIQALAPTPNFCVKTDTVIFLYNAYEIATYAKGEIEVAVPMYRLRTVLKPECRVVKRLMETTEEPERKVQFQP